jgi:hypothetical protein
LSLFSILLLIQIFVLNLCVIKARKINATLIFLIAFKVDRMAYEKVSGDCYNWFIKSLIEKMVSILETMTMYSEKGWNLYLLGEPDETRQNMRDMVLGYGLDKVFRLLKVLSKNLLKCSVEMFDLK